MKCLLVDESTTMRRIFANALRSSGGHEVIEASDVESALRCCDGTIQAVITEWNLPRVAGLELVKHLRQSEATKAVRIMMVTARNGRQEVLQALQAGVNVYLLKPFSGESLRSKLDELLSSPDDMAPIEEREAAA